MRPLTLRPLSLVTGLAVILLALVALGQQPAATEKWEFKILTDVNEKEATKLANDRWNFVGYLGISVRGSGSDETLWRRPAK